MYAFVSNGFQTIVKTSEQLDVLLGIFPFPKFQKVYTEAEGREWIKQNSRVNYASVVNNYGSTSSKGYAEIDYFIDGGNLYYNVKTDKVGYIRVDVKQDVLVDSRPELLKIKIRNIALDNILISHHVLAVQRILKLLGPYIDVNINLPDMSVYLALTKYTGNNFVIKRTREVIDKRLGVVAYTVKEDLRFDREDFSDMFDL